jgi:hypothetical protein
MFKKHKIAKSRNNYNSIVESNTYTNYNNNLKLNTRLINDKTYIANNNYRNVHSLFESPSIQNSSNVDSNYLLGLNFQTQAHSLSPPPQLNSTNTTDFSNKKLIIPKEILNKLHRTVIKIKKKKKLNNLKEKDSKNVIAKKIFDKKKLNINECMNNFSKTSMGFGLHKNQIKLEENEKGKNQYKELRFKVHNTIKSNRHPLCNNFINKAHLFNEKILEYYQSDHYINSIRNFQNNFHYNLDLENNPKIKMYTDIKSLEKLSKTNKLDFKKCFSEKEQKLILLDPAYYFQKDNPENFINVNIVKKKNLADRIKEEDEEEDIKQLLNKFLNNKNRPRKRNSITYYDYNDTKNEEKQKERKLMSKVNKILNENNINDLNSKNLKNLKLTNICISKRNKSENLLKKNDNYDFFKSYKTYAKESNIQAIELSKDEKQKKSKKNNIYANIDNKLRKCILQLHYVSKDKELKKRAKNKIYYDRAKDEKNKFNIFTRQMLIEQNYNYLSKFGRRVLELNENDKNNINTSNKKKYKSEEDDHKNIKEKEMTDNKEKKVINMYINKIKLLYKHQ